MTGELGTSGVVGVTGDIDLIRAQVNALRELASDPDKAKDSARVYAFSIRWGVLLAGRVERLGYYHRRGELRRTSRHAMPSSGPS